MIRRERHEIVAHTMLSRVRIDGPDIDVLILTPMSVRPDRQRQGVGGELVEAALAAADDAALQGRVVYPSFFSPPPTHAGRLDP